MKYYIDNLVKNAINAANKKGHKISISIKEKCPWSPYQKWWYVIEKENGGCSYLLCEWTSIRNLIFHVYFLCVGQKIEKWSFADDFYCSEKM